MMKFTKINLKGDVKLNSATLLSEKILEHAYKRFASDIHFYPLRKQTNIYFRINGKRVLYRSITNAEYELLLAYYKFSSKMDIGEIRKPQNGTITHHSKHGTYSLRLSTLPLNHDESLAIRILPQEENYTMDHLFLFPSQMNILKSWTKHRSGIILMTGPTGSGKTTTLYSLLEDILQEESYQAITLEDPIEKELHHILQVQINERAGITYQTGLKAALRHDPDILMVGEIRDKFTAQFSFEAALTGHLVLSTLHAKDTVGTIHRLLDMGIKQVELEQSLIAVAAIDLLPIKVQGEEKRRGAILELLDGERLKTVLRGGDLPDINNHVHSFHYLRKRALAYGFISEETFQNQKE